MLNYSVLAMATAPILIATATLPLAVDLALASLVVAGLIAVWKAARVTEKYSREERLALAKQLEALTNALIKIQDSRMTETLEREDKTHEVLKQYALRLQEIGAVLSQLPNQLQTAILLALKLDGGHHDTEK